MPRTFPFNVAVGTAPIQIFAHNESRTGFVLCNRTAGQVCFIGVSSAITVTSNAVVRLLTNEILTYLKLEGDDPTKEIWAVGSAALVLDCLESVG